MPPLHHISLSPFSSSYLVLHTPLPPITLFLLFAQPFQLSSVPGLDWSSPFIYPLPCTGISSVRHLFVLILRPPLLIFSSTHPRIILFPILPCARPLNRNESRVQHFIPVPGYLVGNTAPLSSFSQIFLSITIASHGIYSSPYTIFERNVFFFLSFSSSLGLSKSLQ